jgi:hypothetical protein
MGTRHATAALLLSLLAGCQTPITGSETIVGGVRENRLAENVYVLDSLTNGYTPPGQIKAQTRLRAQQIAKANGFNAFSFQETRLRFSLNSGGFTASTVVELLRLADVQKITSLGIYTVDEPIPYARSYVPGSDVKVARFEGSGDLKSSLSVFWVMPVFFDSFGTAESAPFAKPTYYVSPGPFEVIVYAYVLPKVFGTPRGIPISLKGQFDGGELYRVNAEYASGAITVWLEEARTGRRFPSVRVPLAQ